MPDTNYSRYSHNNQRLGPMGSGEQPWVLSANNWLLIIALRNQQLNSRTVPTE